MANYKYTGDVKFNNNIIPLYQSPLDAREVIDEISGLYITKGTETEKNAPLYNKAYAGMTVKVFVDGEPVVMVLKDDTPYTPGKVITINADNYSNYWIVVGKDVRDYVNNVLVPSIDASISRIDASINRIDESLDSSVQRIDASINANVARIDSSIARIDASINRIDLSLDSSVQRIDASLNAIKTSLDTSTARLDSSVNLLEEKMVSADLYYNPNGHKDDEKMYSPHGNLKAGTTVAELKAMKLSDIFSAILLETVTPVKTKDMSGSISFNNYSTTQEVGSALPLKANFSNSFLSEIWTSTSSSGATVDTFTLSLKNESGVVYYFNTSSTASGGSDVTGVAYTTMNDGKVAEQTYYYYGDIPYTGYQDAKDTTGKTIQPKKSGTKTTSTISFSGKWYIYSNATKVSTTDIYGNRNTNPGSFAGNDASTSTSVFASSGTKLYLLWPKIADTEKLYIYIPNSRTIKSCYGAAPSASKETEEFINDLNPTLVTTVSHTNAKSVTGTFKKYTINNLGGITTALVTLS